jgi:hypothetical protein
MKWAASRQNQHNGFATSMDPDQPVHPRSLIRIHAYTVQSNGQTAVPRSTAVQVYTCRRTKHNWRTVGIHLFLTYPNCFWVNQCYGFIVNIQRSKLTNFWPCASFTSREFCLKITTLSDEMWHFYFKVTKTLFSYDNKSFYYTIRKRRYRLHRLVWINAGHKPNMLVLSWRGSMWISNTTMLYNHV